MVDWNSATLVELLGAVDSLDQPQPVWNRPSTIIGMTIVFAVVSGTCVTARLYTRIRILKSPGWDDFLISTFLVGGAVGTICLCIAPSVGLGRHLTTLTEHEFRTTFLLFYIANGTFVTTTNLIKLSLLLQYLRVFDQNIPRSASQHKLSAATTTTAPSSSREQKNWMRIVCLTIMGIVVVWGVIIAFMAWFPCFPVRAYWDWSVENAKCYGFGARYAAPYYYTFLAHCIINMLLDLAILALPVPLFFQQDIPGKTKLGLAGLWFLGALCNTFAFLRLIFTVQQRATTYPTFDHTWYAPRLDLLGMVEVNFACFCASIPVFWPVVVEKFANISDIFVTREIKVEVSHRNHGYMNTESDDGIELHTKRSEPSRSDQVHSRDGSEASLGLKFSKGERSNHYQDDYILDQVDPLRQKTIVAMDSEITTGKRGRG